MKADPPNHRRFQEAIHALTRRLSVVDLDAPYAAHLLASDLHELWGGDTMVYRPAPLDVGWTLEFFAGAGGLGDARCEAAFLDYLRRASPSWAAYDPLLPQPEQRNTIADDNDFPPPDVAVETIPIIRDLYRTVGIFGLSQMRALVCHGPLLLGWVGGFREEPFTGVEKETLTALLPLIQRRLRVERSLRQTDGGATALALEAVNCPAFLVRSNGLVEETNSAGALLFRQQGAKLGARLAASVRGEADPTLSVTSLTASGLVTYSLVLVRCRATEGRARIEAARRRWKLTPRQTDVLARLAYGDCNKDIAARLRIAAGTLELHVSAILDKAKAESRAHVVAKVWTDE